MLLNIWDSIRDFFGNLFKEFSLTSLLSLLTGIAIGIMICLMLYLVTLIKSVKTVEKKNAFDSKKIRSNQLNISEEEELILIKKYIKASQDEFKEKQALYNASNKFELAKEISINLANDVAKMYYPKSSRPLLELSIDELIKLDYYIMARIERIFEGRILKLLKRIRISQIMYILDKKKQVEDSKIVKAAKKLNVAGIGRAIKGALNIVNPTYWVKKGSAKITLEVGFNKIANIIFEIIGEETAKIYSKKAFEIYDLDSQEAEIENEIISEIKERD